MDNPIILEDQITGEHYRLIVEEETLILLNVAEEPTGEALVVDDNDLTIYKLIVENGILKLEVK